MAEDTQEKFDRYLRQLSPKEPCKFMQGMVVKVCTEEKFSCPYRGSETFTLREGKRKECKRENVLRIKRILGS
ncbi:MAG: hypothetical protein KJ709_04845 [Nanoarchaeota archaeon]|nr:hypothetical protein [Nanoarchaeota archaeon]